MTRNKKILVRDTMPEDAAAVGRIHAAGWERAYRGIFSDEYLDDVIKKKLEKIEQRAELYRNSAGIYLVATDESGKIIGTADGSKQEWRDNIPESEKQFQLSALYLDPVVIGNVAVVLALVREFAHRVAARGGDKFIGSTPTKNRAARLYDKLGKRLIEKIDGNEGHGQPETYFEFDVKRFI